MLEAVTGQHATLETLKRAIDCLPIQTGITITDLQGRIVYVNSVQAELYGYGRDDLLGLDLRVLWPACTHDRLSKSPLPEAPFRNRESRGVHSSGRNFPVLLSSMPVSDDQGRCIGIVTACEDITGRRASEERIEYLAHYDSLTQLPNRALFMDRLQQALVGSRLEGERPAGEQLALLVLDLDNFKDLNDSRSHEFGDKFLQEVARRLSYFLSDPRVLARVGGDEFALMLPDCGAEQAAAVALGIRELFTSPFLIDGLEFFSSTSIGIALYPEDGGDVEMLLRSADAAMYHAKGLGRCNYQFFSREMNSRIMRRVALESSIRQGIARGEFSLQYQPQWDLKTNTLTGVEALLRWNSAEFGPVAPGEFIPVAEMSGLILELGKVALTMACRQARQWRDTLGELKVAVNISGRQFSHPDFKDTVARIVRESGITPSSLELEFTESMIMEKADRHVNALQSLKEMGVCLSIDDFGTGYSSLSYLKHFPIDAIKIDRSFIAEVASNSDDAAITEAIISMGHTLKLQVVAEGVETESQLQFLRERGCDGAQGFFFAAPMSPEDFAAFIGNLQDGHPRRDRSRPTA